jgi:1-deoxyxylulose-5-phosphate synthase
VADCGSFGSFAVRVKVSKDRFHLAEVGLKPKSASSSSDHKDRSKVTFMNYVKLGRTGLDVSRICLGCMSYGDPKRGKHAWTLPEDESRPFIRKALDLGINFFDTANSYSAGSSEEILGRALKEFAQRDEVVVATKVFFADRSGPNIAGLSRKAIFQAIDASLQRLGMDYVDLYQIHRFDYDTPLEETLEALHDVVKSGKVRYIGASSMHAWQFAKALAISAHHGWTRFATMQNHLNLLYREEEREMLPLCQAEGIGVIPWSPLARGRLTHDWDEKTARTETDDYGKTLYAASIDADRSVAGRVAEIATAFGLPRAQIALAWVLQKSEVTAPIIGATKMQHLDDAVAALSVTLGAKEIKALEEPYVPHPVVGFI